MRVLCVMHTSTYLLVQIWPGPDIGLGGNLLCVVTGPGLRGPRWWCISAECIHLGVPAVYSSPQVERLYRDVRAYAIPGGSEEILLDLGVRQAVKLGQERKSKL